MGATGNLEKLREAAYEASRPQAAICSRSAREEYRIRSASVRDYVLLRAGGLCEACQDPAPFNRVNGTSYLEPHHLIRVADDGPDDPRYVAAVCPNCHRRCHYGDDGPKYNEALLRRIGEIEREIT